MSLFLDYYMILILIFFVQLLLFSLLFAHPSLDSTLISYLFIVVNVGITLLYIAQKTENDKIRDFLFLALFVRIALMLVDIHHIFPLMHSGADSEAFHHLTIKNINNGELLFKRTNYTDFLYLIYLLSDSQRIIAQYLNVILGLLSIVYVEKTLTYLAANHKVKEKVVLLMTFFPTHAILSSILLREAWVIFFVTLSVCYFVKWMKEPTDKCFVYSILSVLAASYMHSGTLLLATGYGFGLLFYSKKEKKEIFSTKTIVYGAVLGVALIGLLTFTDVFTGKFNSLNEEEDLIGSLSYTDRGAGSAYLTWVQMDSPKDFFLFSPLKLFYFLFSPLPLDWRGLGDIIAFFLDSLLYIYLFYIYSLNRKKGDTKSKLLSKYLFVAVLVTAFVFGWGTSNSGTAIRHRCKLLPVLLICCVEKKEESDEQ